MNRDWRIGAMVAFFVVTYCLILLFEVLNSKKPVPKSGIGLSDHQVPANVSGFTSCTDLVTGKSIDCPVDSCMQWNFSKNAVATCTLRIDPPSVAAADIQKELTEALKDRDAWKGVAEREHDEDQEDQKELIRLYTRIERMSPPLRYCKKSGCCDIHGDKVPCLNARDIVPLTPKCSVDGSEDHLCKKEEIVNYCAAHECFGWK